MNEQHLHTTFHLDSLRKYGSCAACGVNEDKVKRDTFQSIADKLADMAVELAGLANSARELSDDKLADDLERCSTVLYHAVGRAESHL